MGLPARRGLGKAALASYLTGQRTPAPPVEHRIIGQVGSVRGARRPRKSILPRNALQQLIARNYPALAQGLLGPLLDLLSLTREACGGDSDKFLIMLVVAIRTTAHKDFASYTSEQLDSGEVAVFPSLGINIQSIADSIGAPKETVRRKVTELVEAGWLARQGSELYLTGRAAADLTPAREQIEQMALRYHEIVEALAERAERAEPARACAGR
jgi:hypothetical protein